MPNKLIWLLRLDLIVRMRVSRGGMPVSVLPNPHDTVVFTRRVVVFNQSGNPTKLGQFRLNRI